MANKKLHVKRNTKKRLTRNLVKRRINEDER